MSDIQSKLAAGIREAKKQQDEPPADKGTSKAQAGKGAAPRPKPAPKPARKPSRSAADAQTPAETGDDPWNNLHPDRVWPD